MWNVIMTRFLNVAVKNQKILISKYWALTTTTLKKNYMCTDNFSIDLLSAEDKEKILKIINSKSTQELLQYSITKTRAKKLELHRMDNGPFKSLDDLLQVYNKSNKWVYNFYKSIICGKKKSSRKIISGLVVTPQNTDHKDVNTVLGIYVGYDLISWSLLNRNCEVLQWNYKSFSRENSKENIHSLLQKIIPIARKLPKAERYIMQETGGDTSHACNHQFYQNFMQQSIIGAIILSYLTMVNTKFNDTSDFVTNNIFILRQRVLRKIYGLVIGNETISTQYMVRELMQENDELIKTKEPKVLIRTELRQMYDEQSPVYQEQIGWSLLIALAFIELILHKRTDMIIREAPQRL